MNIFEEYLNKISSLVLKNQKNLELSNFNNFKGITVESPPSEFNCDLSCNISLVLAKINKTNPTELANKIKKSNIDRSICDFIAGMTDRFAINLYNKSK